MILYDGPEFGFDRAMSKDMDNTVGDDCQSSKSINANNNAFDFTAMSFTGNTVANDSKFALAA